jgi:hypothetical protein
MSDDWLWDGRDEPDPETKRLLEALRPLRYEGPPPRLPRRHRVRWALPAALLLAAAILLSLWWGRPRAAWSCGEGCLLEVGQWLAVGSEPVQLEVADIGTMRVSPGSRLRLLETSSQGHRLQLDRGHVHASVLAPPRLLVVDTPSASAVDLGCEYDLTVLDDGSSLLVVYTGEVSLEGRALSYVPAGAAAMTWPGHGPGVPWFAEGPVAYAEALVAYEREGQTDLLPEILAQSRRRDTLSLWHLLHRVPEPERAQVLARIHELAPESALSEGEEALFEVLSEIWSGG